MLDLGWFELASISLRVHILLEILVHVLKHQHQLVLCVDDIMQGDYVLVAKLLHKRYLADGSRGRPFLRV